MSLLFDALGHDALGHPSSAGGTITTLNVTVASLAISGVATTFTVQEAWNVTAYTIASVAVTFSDRELIAPAAVAISAGGAVTFTVSEAVAAGAWSIAGQPVNETILEVETPAAISITFQPLTALYRTGDDFDPTRGGVGHYKMEIEAAKRLAAITRKVPPPVDRRTAPTFGPIGSSPIAPAAPPVDVRAIEQQRMAAQMQAAAAAKRRREAQAILLLAS